MPMFYSQLSAILGAEGCHPLLPPQSGGVCLFIIYSHSKYKLVQYSVKYLVYNIQYSVIYILARAGGGGGGAPINSASCRWADYEEKDNPKYQFWSSLSYLKETEDAAHDISLMFMLYHDHCKMRTSEQNPEDCRWHHCGGKWISVAGENGDDYHPCQVSIAPFTCVFCKSM